MSVSDQLLEGIINTLVEEGKKTGTLSSEFLTDKVEGYDVSVEQMDLIYKALD